MAKKNVAVESILDLNSNNVWGLEESEIARMWEDEKSEENFSSSEEKLLNIIRLAFEVVHYDKNDQRDVAKYENGEWATMEHCNPRKGAIAVRKKHITRLVDLSYENIRHITAATLLELIDRNFGGGWDSISLPMRDIIESGFDISTTSLPASRIHASGGTLERKVAAGYDVLEITKGTWVEAIFAKKKDPVEKLRFLSENKYDEEGNRIRGEEDEEIEEKDTDLIDEDEEQNDETYYSTFAEEAVSKEETEEGFPVED